MSKRKVRGENDDNAESGRDVVEFAVGELVFVGAEYGLPTLQATTDDATRALDAFAEAARRGGCRIDISATVVVHDGEETRSEDWHAGLARTPENGVRGLQRSESATGGTQSETSRSDG